MPSPLRRRILASVSLTVTLGLLATALGASALELGPQSPQGPGIVINELQYDPPGGQDEPGHEWVELYNGADAAVSLKGWSLADNRSTEDLGPAASLAPRAFLVVAGGPGFAADHPGFVGQVLVLDGAIGNGLGNGGDELRLRDAAGRLVDAMSYGDNAEALDPPAPAVAGGHSLERAPTGADTDRAEDWLDQGQPSPGQGVEAAAETATPSPEPGPPPQTSPPGGPAVRLNEHLPAPRDVDWDGDGQAGQNDEWIELFNPGPSPAYLRGWQLDDIPAGGSAPYVFPSGAVVGPRGHLLVFKRDSGLSLNNGGDSVRLLDPAGAEVDRHDYTAAGADESLARLPDGDGGWSEDDTPSPGSSNAGGDWLNPTPTPDGANPTPDGSPTRAAPPSPTPGAPPQPSPTGGVFLPLLISEVLFDPLTAGDDAAEEWIELFNPGPRPVALAGWQVGDRGAWDALPGAQLGPGAFLVVRASGGALIDEAASVPHLTLADGQIGGGLSNQGDLVRLRDPAGRLADSVSYGANLDAFDPSVPLAPAGSSIERVPPGQDRDSAQDWWVQGDPSPGRAGSLDTGPPPLRLSEVLPAPLAVDWDGDGTADLQDEWVELKNEGARALDVGGWRLEDRAEDGWSYALPAGTRLAAGAFLVVPRRDSGIALDRDQDTLRLHRPDGVEADRVTWSASPGYDKAICRVGQDPGSAEWAWPCDPSPGAANRLAAAGEPAVPAAARPTPRPTAGPLRAALSELRDLPPGAWVEVSGQITAAAGVFGERSLYLGDAHAGVKVYLSQAGATLPSLPEGEFARAAGRLRDFHGERELAVRAPADVWSLGPGAPLAPVEVASGELGEAAEGRLVLVAGWAEPIGRAGFTLDDGSGPAAVYLHRTAGISRPADLAGRPWSVTGIAGQYLADGSADGGYRLQPRRPEDLGLAPVTVLTHPVLPMTGRR